MYSYKSCKNCLCQDTRQYADFDMYDWLSLVNKIIKILHTHAYNIKHNSDYNSNSNDFSMSAMSVVEV